MSKKYIENFSEIDVVECHDLSGYVIDCDSIQTNVSNEVWKNNLLYSQYYCRSDCNGIINLNDNNNPISCDTSNINNLDEYNKKINEDVMLNEKDCNINKIAPKKEFTMYYANEELLNSKLKKSLNNYKGIVNKNNDSDYKYINKTIQNIIDLEDKTMDAINATENDKILEHFTNTDDFSNNLKKTFRKYTNFVSMAMEIVNNYKDAILDENNKITQKDASFIMRATYQSFKNDGTVYGILGSDNNILEFERLILEKTNVDLTEQAPVNGVTVDENGNLQEHGRGAWSPCYLITALIKKPNYYP